MNLFNMNKPLLVFFIFLCLTLLWSCQPGSVEEKHQSKLFAEFYLRLVQDEPLVKGEVSFFEGDSLSVARPRTFKQVLINNQLMAAKELKMKGTSYRGSLNGLTDSIYTFSFINANDEQQSYQLSVDRIDAFLIKDGWTKSTGMSVVWKGTPLSEQEELVLLFTDKKNKSSIIEVSGPTKHSEVILTTDQLAPLNLGPGKLYLVRKTNRQTVTEKTQFTSRVEFFTAPISLTVKE